MDEITHDDEDKQPLSVLDSPKARNIRDACEVAEQSSRVDDLIALAISEGGFLHDHLRQKAWPILLGSSSADLAPLNDWKQLPEHRDEEQVARDVDRSFVYYPAKRSPSHLATLRDSLSNLIVSVLRTHPELCYFQGYHDISTVILLALGEDASQSALARLSLLRIRDFMLPSMTGAVLQLHLVPALLKQSDPDLANYLPPDPFYALSATLTLFSHLVGDYDSIARTFDFLLATPASAPVYLYVAAIRLRRQELKELDPDDHDMLHFFLSKMPQHIDFDALVKDAHYLITEYPPHSLGTAFNKVPPSSVVRTVTLAQEVRKQSLDQAKEWFEEEAEYSRKLEQRQKMMRNAKILIKKYKGPVSWAGSAVVVALLAVLLARHGEGRYGLLGNVMSSVWRSIGGL